MGRPKGPPYRKINLAPPKEVVEAMEALADTLGMTRTALWELAARRLLKTAPRELKKGMAK